MVFKPFSKWYLNPVLIWFWFELSKQTADPRSIRQVHPRPVLTRFLLSSDSILVQIAIESWVLWRAPLAFESGVSVRLIHRCSLCKGFWQPAISYIYIELSRAWPSWEDARAWSGSPADQPARSTCPTSSPEVDRAARRAPRKPIERPKSVLGHPQSILERPQSALSASPRSLAFNFDRPEAHRHHFV